MDTECQLPPYTIGIYPCDASVRYAAIKLKIAHEYKKNVFTKRFSHLLQFNDQEHLNEINKLINKKEIEIAIDSLNSDAAPGSNGLTANFYKIFKKTILTDLYELFNNIFLKGKMPKLMGEAIVKLSYKKIIIKI